MALVVLYVVFLVKLRPSTKRQNQNREDIVSRKLRKNKLIYVNAMKPKKNTKPPQKAEKQVDLQKIQNPPTNILHPTTLTNKTQVVTEHPIMEESQTPKTECIHHFGYLRTLPRSRSIPSECLGCLEIVECLTARIEDKSVKAHVTQS